MDWIAEVVEVHQRPVLRGVSFAVAPRGITALAGGPEGAGTLLFRMIAGLADPDRGAVIVLGEDMSHARGRRRARIQRRLGVVFGGRELALFAAASARENVAVAVRGAGRTARRSRAAAVDAALEAAGLAGRADARPDELTGMERKRLAVARALALRSPLVVADGFDEGAGGAEVRALAALIGEDRARMGGAALLVMADRDLAADVADEVIDLGALLDRSGEEALDGRLGEYLRPDERERAAQL